MFAVRVFLLLLCAFVYGNTQRTFELKENIADLEKKIYESVRELASYRDPVGVRKLAEMYETGTNHVKQNECGAVRLYSSLKDAASIYKVGMSYLFGDCILRNEQEAMRKFQEAEALGYVPAIAKVGLMYYRGLGVNRDMEQAISRLDRASKLGHSSSTHYLGTLFEKGSVLPQNSVAAAGFYHLASEQGYQLYSREVALVNEKKMEGLFTLGSLYESGNIFKLDLATALKNYEKAAELGHLPSMEKLVGMYARGQGTLHNFAEAKKWSAIMIRDHRSDVEASLNLFRSTRRRMQNANSQAPFDLNGQTSNPQPTNHCTQQLIQGHNTNKMSFAHILNDSFMDGVEEATQEPVFQPTYHGRPGRSFAESGPSRAY